MKQTLEEVARSELFSSYACTSRILSFNGLLYNADAMLNMFRRGAEWQAKQMAWINVNNKMPEDGIEVDERTIFAHTKDVIVLYKNGCVGKGKRIYDKKGWQWSCLKAEDITHWMYYPN